MHFRIHAQSLQLWAPCSRGLQPASLLKHCVRRRRTWAKGRVAELPSLKEEGWTRHQKRCREATFDGADGVVGHEGTFGLPTTPPAALAKRKRDSAQH
jgi:hypothetical protein